MVELTNKERLDELVLENMFEVFFEGNTKHGIKTDIETKKLKTFISYMHDKHIDADQENSFVSNLTLATHRVYKNAAEENIKKIDLGDLEFGILSQDSLVELNEKRREKVKTYRINPKKTNNE